MGYTLYNGPEQPSLLWSYVTGFVINGSATIGVDGTVYFGSNDESLYAINNDGTLKW